MAAAASPPGGSPPRVPPALQPPTGSTLPPPRVVAARPVGQAPGPQMDPAHRERHQTVMHQLSELRLGALDTDRGRLLASLILIDRELIAHIADAALVFTGA